MYERILVALDGSELAERVLPYVEELASRLGSAVTLLRAITPAETIVAQSAGGVTSMVGPGAIIDPGPIVEAERRDATAYLQAVSARLRGRGLQVDAEVVEGAAAEALAGRAEALGVGLVAMTTHGRGGLGRLVFGSVADAVLRHAPCPVFLVRIHEAG